MIQLDQRRYMISGSYPKNPILRQNRRGKTPPATDYGKVDLAMREPVRIINEELKLRTFACCEYHPCDANRRQYEVFRYEGQECCYTYRLPYRSYIVLNLVKYYEVQALRDFLVGPGFVTDGETSYHGCFDSMDMDDEEGMIHPHKGFKAEFPRGILGIRYASDPEGEPINGQCSIDVTPFERQYIRQWKEWDNVRDTGWEYWLELLRRYVMQRT